MSQYEIDSLIQKLSNKSSKQKPSNHTVLKTQNISLYYNKYSITFIIYMIISCFWILICHTSFPLMKYVSFAWSTIIFIGILLVIFVKCRKVKEGIGCLKEAYILLTYLAINITVTMLLNTENDRYPFVPMAHAALVPITGLLPLYVSLYYVYKAEGSLKISTVSSHFSLASLSKSPSLSSTSNNAIKNNRANLKMPIIVFLAEQANYESFAKYLAYCFCLENLLFIQTASVYYQTVINVLENKSKNNVANEDRENKIILRIKFEYLNDLYNEYEDAIQNKITETEFNANNKNVLYDACKVIFDQYIAQGSLYEINVSYQCRSRLAFLLTDKTNLDKFESFNDFVNLFDEALLEIYRLMLSMYNYRFQQYCDTLNKESIN